MESAPLSPRRTTSTPAGKPGPSSSTVSTSPPPVAPGDGHRDARALGGVGEDVVEEHVDERHQVGLAGVHRRPPARRAPSTGSRAPGPRPAAPRRRPGRPARRARACRRRVPPARSAGPRCTTWSTMTWSRSRSSESRARSSPAGSASMRSRSEVIGVRRRCDRSETASRSRASSSSMRPTRRWRPRRGRGPRAVPTAREAGVRRSPRVCAQVASPPIGWTNERPTRSAISSAPSSSTRPRPASTR